MESSPVRVRDGLRARSVSPWRTPLDGVTGAVRDYLGPEVRRGD